LKASGGAIVPEKTFWYLSSSKWTGGKWAYQSIAESPGALYVSDITGRRKLLRRFEPSHEEVTLRVALAPDGNTAQQAKNMKKAAINWSDAMQMDPYQKTTHGWHLLPPSGEHCYTHFWLST
jgi:hypothetical protein